ARSQEVWREHALCAGCVHVSLAGERNSWDLGLGVCGRILAGEESQNNFLLQISRLFISRFLHLH
ncbi:Hypothetical predicted protein, partial [Pelobates cultripes]